MLPTATYQLSLMSSPFYDVQPWIMSWLSLKDAYNFLRTCTYTYNKVRPNVLARLPKWFAKHAIQLERNFDEVARFAVREVAKCPSDARFAEIFLRLFQHGDVISASDIGIGLASAGCHGGLREVDLQRSRISDAGLSCIACNDQLTALDLYACKNITDTGIEIIAQRCKDLARVILNKTNISSKGVMALITHCPELSLLDLGNCRDVTDDAVLPLATRCCPKLAGLYLGYCGRITDVGIRAIATGCTRLAELSAAESEITDEGVSTLLNACTNLTKLDLSSTHISDKGLFSIARAGENLKVLSLESCTGIKDAAVQAVLDSCGNLVGLALFESGASTTMRAKVDALFRERWVRRISAPLT